MKNKQEWAEVELLSHSIGSETLILTGIRSVYSKNITKAEHVHENRLYEILGLNANEFIRLNELMRIEFENRSLGE